MGFVNSWSILNLNIVRQSYTPTQPKGSDSLCCVFVSCEHRWLLAFRLLAHQAVSRLCSFVNCWLFAGVSGLWGRVHAYILCWRVTVSLNERACLLWMVFWFHSTSYVLVSSLFANENVIVTSRHVKNKKRKGCIVKSTNIARKYILLPFIHLLLHHVLVRHNWKPLLYFECQITWQHFSEVLKKQLLDNARIQSPHESSKFQLFEAQQLHKDTIVV